MSFQSLRLYVKSIWRIIEVQNMPFLAFLANLEALKIDFCEFLHFLKVDTHHINKIQSPKNGKNITFLNF